MKQEGREIFQPKQEYRALRRGFFIADHPKGKHLYFSDRMAQEALTILVNNVIFKKLPPEWISKEVTQSLNSLSNEAGKWFEKIVSKNLNKLSIEHVSLTNRPPMLIGDFLG